MDELDKMIRSLNLLNETELEALVEVCQARVEGKKKARREALRQELMGNLQKAIGDILHNGFSLTIMNTERGHRADDFDEVYFNPEDIYSIRIIE
jgi:predicted DNA-binding transcriptional regulator YafY